MNRLMLAAAATALCAAATTFTAPAEAGMRFGGGFRFHHFAFRPHYSSPPVYKHDDDDERVRRKTVRRQAKPDKSEKKVPLVKFADGTGRQYDPASKVWFDGKSQCYSGKQAFTFKNDAWFYGSSRWASSNGGWQSASAEQPELVSCDSVAKFAAKANATTQSTQIQGAAAAAQGNKVETATQRTSDKPAGPPSGQAAKIKTAEGDTATKDKPAGQPSQECKKYFPSVGQMLTVPCGE